MAKRGPLGSLGNKPPTNRRASDAKPAPSSDLQREEEYDLRLHAFVRTTEALQMLTTRERTQVVAAVAEFFRLSLTVEN